MCPLEKEKKIRQMFFFTVTFKQMLTSYILDLTNYNTVKESKLKKDI